MCVYVDGILEYMVILYTTYPGLNNPPLEWHMKVKLVVLDSHRLLDRMNDMNDMDDVNDMNDTNDMNDMDDMNVV